MEHPPKDFTVEESSYLFRVLQAIEAKLNIVYNRVLNNFAPTTAGVSVVGGVMRLPAGTSTFSLTSGTTLSTIKASESDIGRIITINLTAAGLTITNSASLILKDGFDKFTFANDVIVLQCIGIDTWVELQYIFALGKPSARVYRNNVDLVVSTFSVATIFPNNVKITDVYNNYSTSTFLFTCPTDGYYSVYASTRLRSFTGSTVVVTYIFLNSGLYAYNSGTPAANLSTELSVVIKCAKGDTLAMYYNISGTAATYFGEQGSQFAVTML